VIELVLVEQDDPGDFAANGDYPGDGSKDAQACGSALLTLRRTPIFRHVGLWGPPIVGHVQIPPSDLCATDVGREA
jgi:hypothetical protein